MKKKTALSILTCFMFLFLQNTFAQKKVLIEQFTNSGCPPCAGNTPIVAAYANTNPDSVLMIAYHTSFPYLDSMYFENTVMSDARVSYYSISGVPAGRIDGNFFSGNLVPVLSTSIPSRMASVPLYGITFNSAIMNNSQLTTQIACESFSNSNQSEALVVQIAVVEKNVLKSSYSASPGANTENVYPWVARQLLPDENGTSLLNKYSGGIDVINANTILVNIKDPSQVRLIAFIQNTVTKEVYQSEISTPIIISSLNETNSPAFNLTLYPSVVSNTLKIHIEKPNANLKFTLTNILGSKLYSISIPGNSLDVSTSEFSSGVYFANFSDGIHTETKRFIISK